MTQSVMTMEEPEPPPPESYLAERENRTLMVRWSSDTRAILVMEFIRENQLFAQLNEFLRKRIR